MPRCAARTAGTVLRARSKPMTFASPIAKLNLLNAKRKAIHARQTRPGVSVALNQNTFGIEASGPVPPGGGAMAAFYGKVSVPTGAPIYISYLGGTGYDDARTLTRTGDPERLVISGTTYSANFPVSGGGSAMDSSCGPPCNSDNFDSYLRGQFDDRRARSIHLCWRQRLGLTRSAGARWQRRSSLLSVSRRTELFRQFPHGQPASSTRSGAADATFNIYRLEGNVLDRVLSTFIGGPGENAFAYYRFRQRLPTEKRVAADARGCGQRWVPACSSFARERRARVGA